MKIEGYQLEKTDTICPYLENRIFTSNNLMVNTIDEDGLEVLLESGYRHFGEYFFRPECNNCNECQPIRIPVKKFTFSRSEKRIISKNRKFLVTIIDNPIPDMNYYTLYKEHKMRFKENESELYENWVDSFFSKLSFSRILEIWDNDTLVAVTHLDSTNRIISAVYCYWNKNYFLFSPGKYSILKGIQYAIERDVEYYYLGYYIKDNKHMSYKANYIPNEVLKDGVWQLSGR